MNEQSLMVSTTFSTIFSLRCRLKSYDSWWGWVNVRDINLVSLKIITSDTIVLKKTRSTTRTCRLWLSTYFLQHKIRPQTIEPAFCHPLDKILFIQKLVHVLFQICRVKTNKTENYSVIMRQTPTRLARLASPIGLTRLKNSPTYRLKDSPDLQDSQDSQDL